ERGAYGYGNEVSSSLPWKESTYFEASAFPSTSTTGGQLVFAQTCKLGGGSFDTYLRQLFDTSGNITFFVGTNAYSGVGTQAKCLNISKSGNVVVGAGAGAIATNATNGFLSITSCAGAPTGTPSAEANPSGSLPMVYDTTNNKLWVYNGSAWKGVVLS